MPETTLRKRPVLACLTICAASFSMLTLGACEDNEAEDAVEESADAVEDAADETGDAIEDAADDLDDGGP